MHGVSALENIPSVPSLYGTYETRMLSTLSHMSRLQSKRQWGEPPMASLSIVHYNHENTAPSCRKLSGVSLLKPVNKPRTGEWGILLCLHFVYLLKHLSLIYMKKRSIYFYKPWVLHLSGDPWECLHWGRLSLRCFVFLYR